MGRYLADTLASIPKISPDVFDKLFNDSIQVISLVSAEAMLIFDRACARNLNFLCVVLNFCPGSSTGALSGQFDKNTVISSKEVEFSSSNFLNFLCKIVLCLLSWEETWRFREFH